MSEYSSTDCLDGGGGTTDITPPSVDCNDGKELYFHVYRNMVKGTNKSTINTHTGNGSRAENPLIDSQPGTNQDVFHQFYDDGSVYWSNSEDGSGEQYVCKCGECCMIIAGKYKLQYRDREHGVARPTITKTITYTDCNGKQKSETVGGDSTKPKGGYVPNIPADTTYMYPMEKVGGTEFNKKTKYKNTGICVHVSRNRNDDDHLGENSKGCLVLPNTTSDTEPGWFKFMSIFLPYINNNKACYIKYYNYPNKHHRG